MSQFNMPPGVSTNDIPGNEREAPIMRTVDEMNQAAIAQRVTLVNEGKDPLEAAFKVTREEALRLRMEPWPGNGLLSMERDRLCGLKLEITR